MIQNLYKHQKRKVNQSELVRARLFDILVGDWSKHEYNWKLPEYKEDNHWKIYRPIPRDRDHVFSRQDGVLPWLADRRFALTNIENFAMEVKDVLSLTWQARQMDRFLATEVTKDLFVQEAQYIQAHISEADIDNAVRQMPAEVYEKSGALIAAKLKNRLKDLQKSALDYYALLAKEVEVVGSIEKEYFEVSYLEQGRVEVKVYDQKDQQKGTELLYHRIFQPKETKEVRLYGLKGDDIFDIQGTATSSIKVQAFGGSGDDTFIDSADKTKTFFYDKGKNTKYTLDGNGKIVHSWNKNIYEYDRERFEYNKTIPLVYVAYNAYSGLGLNLGALINIKKFGKDEYHSKHSITAGYTTNQNLKAAYHGRFHQFLHEWDGQINLSYDEDVSNFFFGLGNTSQKNDNLFDNDFYRTEMKASHFSLGLIKDFWKKSLFDISLGIERYDSGAPENSFLNENTASLFGANEAFTILPISTKLDIDFRDSKGLPYRGTRALIEYENGTLLSEDNKNYGVAQGAIEYYLSTKTKNPLTLGFRVGGAISHGDLPWYKLPTLGQENGLRGYYQNRFAGNSSAFFNVELRYQLLDKYTTFIPIKLGVKVFYDRGRIFFEEAEENASWRYGYGFGFYLVPLTESFTFSISASFSDEERLYPAISIGTPLR
jgi:hypothetical protein